VPLFLIERSFAELVPTDPETEAMVKLVNDEIGIQWLFSFLSADKRKTYCLYEAPNPEAIRAAARRLGIPADSIVEVTGIGPEAALIAAAAGRTGNEAAQQGH
jgi:Nickel responsive protein SCO4226-like